MTEMGRDRYAGRYGPTTGDRVRLADTELWIEITEDATSYGDEPLIGLGKTIRDGQLASPRHASRLDLIVTNVVVLDPLLGVVKGNIGIKDGYFVGVGRAGNPDLVDDVELVIGSTTTVIPGEGLIATPGGVDSHVHLVSPRVVPTALGAGITTLVGMGLGPTWDVGANPPFNLARMEEALASQPVNVALLARAGATRREPLEELAEAGASGFKVHEDTGATPGSIDLALQVATDHDLAVAVHFDGLNESGFLSDFLAAIAGRSVHAYHVEGSGGGPVDLLEVVAEPNVVPSSTTPTLPFTRGALAEQVPMIVSNHGLRADDPGDVAAARMRVRAGTMAAEELLHDHGAISIINSDAMGMGRIGETIRRTWQTADRMRRRFGPGPEGHDNERVLRFLAKYTINPAIAHGFDHVVGSIAPARLADLVLWRPAFFGVKPDLVLKGGFPAWGLIGDANASVERAEPLRYGPEFGALGEAARSTSVTFVSAASRLVGGPAGRRRVAVAGSSRVTKQHMVRNAATPRVRVDLASGRVTEDGAPLTGEPAEELPMSRRYFLG